MFSPVITLQHLWRLYFSFYCDSLPQIARVEPSISPESWPSLLACRQRRFDRCPADGDNSQTPPWYFQDRGIPSLPTISLWLSSKGGLVSNKDYCLTWIEKTTDICHQCSLTLSHSGTRWGCWLFLCVASGFTLFKEVRNRIRAAV